MKALLTCLNNWSCEGEPVACVQVLRAEGSTPREAGAFMLVSAAWQSGTIGGGRLEWESVAHARTLLLSEQEQELCNFVLGPDTGQCCGGRVVIEMMRLDQERIGILQKRVEQYMQARPVIVLFGAGHVGRALMRALSLLPFRLIWIDSRPEEFGCVPDGVEVHMTSSWEYVLHNAPPHSAVLVLTHSHALDALITAAALERNDLSYVGLIGSRTKRRRFEAGFRQMGLSEEKIASLVCPVGERGVGDKRPEIIAAFVAAELAELFLQK